MALMNLTNMRDHPALYTLPLAPEVEEVKSSSRTVPHCIAKSMRCEF